MNLQKHTKNFKIMFNHACKIILTHNLFEFNLELILKYGNSKLILLINYTVVQIRHVPSNERQVAKFQPYNHHHFVQIQSFKMIYDMSGLLPKTYYFLDKFLCFPLISDMFSESYLL